MARKKFSNFVLDLEVDDDEIHFDISANHRYLLSETGEDNEAIDIDSCDVFTSLRLNRNECSDIVNELETVLKNPESTEPPNAKYLDNVEVVDSIGDSSLNLDATPLGLDIHKDFLFCTLFFENKKDLEDFLSFLKDELR